MTSKGRRLGSLAIKLAEHKHAALIVEHAHAAEWRSILKVLRETRLVLGPAGPFTKAGRPKRPKRQRKGPASRNTFALMPIDQGGLNSELHARFGAHRWEAEPLVLGKLLGRELASFLKGDFKKREVFVEVEFGNTASLFRDLFKFQLVGQSKKGEVAVLIVATAAAARLMDSNVATFERIESLMPFLDLVVALPILVVGIEPYDWRPVRSRYNQMKRVAEQHGVRCYSFDEATRLPNKTEKLTAAVDSPEEPEEDE